MTEVDGVGFPLSYCLLSTVNANVPGKRKQVIENWGKQVKERYHLNPRHIGTNKDLGKIGPCQILWPAAKLTICWWHQRKAVQERLKKVKLSTTPYDPMQAKRVFPFIDLGFVPQGQADPLEREGGREGGGRDNVIDDPPAQLAPITPEAVTVAAAKAMNFSLSASANTAQLKVHIPPLKPETLPSSPPPLTPHNPTTNTSVIQDPPRLTIRIPQQKPSSLLAPIVKSEPEAARKQVFCPPELRDAVINKMDAHRHAHPLIPGYAEPSPEGIYLWAVRRMYKFCVNHDLRELWAYLWENWYRPQRWKLWTRSPSPEIPHLRTTMINEAHWRHIKHDFLHYFHKPRVNLLIWILTTKLTPTYQRKLHYLTEDTGRYRGLASWQKAFKREWKKLKSTLIILPLQEEYRPRVRHWVCTCPSQAPSRFLLCKHLVQGVEPVPDVFFLEVTRIRTTPFWVHPGLVPKTGLPEGYLNDKIAPVAIPVDQQLDPQRQTEPPDGLESDEEEKDEYQIEAEFIQKNTNTYNKRMDHLLSRMHNFSLGLRYQKQFRDERFLNLVEKQGAPFFRLVDSCLEKERRQNMNRGEPTSTWDPRTMSAMYYRTRPREEEQAGTS
ncbi:hypothetical protein D9757_012415 [Collybiopsis confluens]|uniref:SWIM-type domain-containing protein n=1 Tax=Collybiopsis confluens TaxID=2823264 RepID=A0A8H5H0K2_9AGAR|nr:hypothetical protein D9757_012415 [Collybiopsis confluens]